ncbi:Putative peptidoglycan binding domain-containing protein [Magnetospirillum fulvum]|uniref:Putative peptidoglycan binding domain-containing protein n=1 Tax=Magnetospirillum fulvum TaxID=1082 RepID=A0A1H6HAQ0_MAGFU|nr:Putative peptidoglycan binding domain-containing protein [Magnetospirillum fulvum]
MSLRLVPLLGLMVGLALGLPGCRMVADPGSAPVVSQPTTPVVKNLTNFSNALRCMDSLFVSFGKRDIVITSDGLPDHTGVITSGTKEMMISAISKMSTKSGAFRYVDVERSGDAVFWFNQNYTRNSLTVPNFYIRGAITQVDQSVLNDSHSASVALPFLSLGYSRDQLVSLVSMDLNMGQTETLQIMPGISSTNTIAIVKSGSSVESEGLIQKASVMLNVSADRSQGTHAAVRNLVELGMIELLGKFTRVPYWRCLEIESTNPEMMQVAHDWFDDLDERGRIRMAQGALRRIGYYDGPEDGTDNRALKDAINRYKSEKDLIANGRVDFDLYFRFVADDLASPDSKLAKSGPGGAPPLPTPTALDNETAGFDPIGLTIAPAATPKGGYHAGDRVRLSVSVQQPADLYCYYESGASSVVRIFPNRFQPNAKLLPGTQVQIPPESGFSIKLDKSGVQERIACIATKVPYPPEKKPAVLSQGDLVPLTQVNNLSSVIYQHQGADRHRSSVRTLTIAVQ